MPRFQHHNQYIIYAAHGLEARHLKLGHQTLKPHMGELLTGEFSCTYPKKTICLLKEK